MFPKITIITPSFNQGQFIEETILSIINQDYDNLEYIIIDGGSTDNTVDIIKKYENKITYWVSEADNGQATAINKGLRLATGEIINWINSDDLLIEGALSKIAEQFVQYPKAMMIHGRIAYFGNQSYYSTNLSPKNLKERYAAHICMPQPACFFRKGLIKEQGFLDENLHFSMDTDLYVRAGLNYDILQVDDVFAKFRLHQNSKSVSSFNQNFLTDNQAIISRVLSSLKANHEIEQLKSLGLFLEPNYLYASPSKNFNAKKLLFYYLEHRMFTLQNTSQREEFKKMFSYLINEYPSQLFESKKLILYRLLLFLPSDFLHFLVRFRNKI